MSTFTKRGHCVYVLFSEADGKLYIGYSSNLKQWLTDHFNGRNQATAPRRPLRLIYCEYHASTTDAHRREKYLKTTAGKKALGLMLRGPQLAMLALRYFEWVPGTGKGVNRTSNIERSTSNIEGRFARDSALLCDIWIRNP